jgi:hypothetical protein
MDTLPVAAQWPEHPYRGLDFYRETDALLFRERGKDIEECAAILLGFGVKILLLQGSSGSGKSSFLRAGLIPHLKREERRNFFLSGRNSVIRCTCDPLPEVAWSLVDTLENIGPAKESTCHGGTSDREALADAAVREEIRRKIEQALPGPREKLADVLVEELVEICDELPGKLVLVLDQAEEVLTLAPSGWMGNETATAFFRFLEGVYLRNVDTRLVVALRTEYYGRFRDELRISDDRLGKRPRSGGVEPYLLRPLREKSALLGIINAPTLAAREDGTSVYDFAFEEGLAEQIADDLVETFPHGSATPALQVVCSSLHERLTEKDRTITHAEYAGLGRIKGIADNYLARGIRASGARTKAEDDKWGELLHCLVSRQGGGTLVSLIQSLEELEREAQDLGIRGDIRAGLVKLTRGTAPLLRGEPPEAPQNFSLKHDVVAVVLARWYSEHEGAAKVKKQAKRWMIGVGLTAMVVALFLGLIIWQRADETFTAKARAIDLTNQHAIRSPEGNFRRSLLLSLANLDATAQSSNIHEFLTRANHKKHVQTLQKLREVLARAPWFTGVYRAAGLDPAGGRMALLTQDNRSLQILGIPSGDGKPAEPELKDYNLPVRSAASSVIRPAAGFVTGLGPVALVNGHAYFWNESDEAQECDLGPILSSSMTSGSWIRGEFVGGRLQLSTVVRHESKSSLRILRIDASQLRTCTTAEAEPLQIPDRPFSQPLPVFSEAPEMLQLYNYLEATSRPARNELAANLPIDPSRADPGKPVQLDAVIGAADGHGRAHIAVGQIAPERGIPERLHYTLAFAANEAATVFKFDGPDFYIYDLGNLGLGTSSEHLHTSPQHVAVTSDVSDEASWRLQPARTPWVYPPLAAARVDRHWRAAWLAPNGVWAVESSDLDPNTARPILHDPLMGEPDGAKLQFTHDGQFLVLQRAQLQLPVSVRIWDLRPSWQGWVTDEKTTEEELREVACRTVRMDSGDGGFNKMEIELFQIDPGHQEPCPKL